LQGVIFVIDSTDKDFEISRKALGDLLKNDDLKTSTFLFMANKQDMKDAMSAADIAEKFNLTDIKDHEWQIQVRAIVYVD
jgi:signal recognition particle receptor subunit beta